MKIFLTVLITFVITSLLWLFFIAFYPSYVPVPKFAEEYQYEQIKSQKEMEYKAEMEIMNDMLKGFDKTKSKNSLPSFFDN